VGVGGQLHFISKFFFFLTKFSLMSFEYYGLLLCVPVYVSDASAAPIFGVSLCVEAVGVSETSMLSSAGHGATFHP
jgi:hypothetical protein